MLIDSSIGLNLSVTSFTKLFTFSSKYNELKNKSIAIDFISDLKRVNKLDLLDIFSTIPKTILYLIFLTNVALLLLIDKISLAITIEDLIVTFLTHSLSL